MKGLANIHVFISEEDSAEKVRAMVETAIVRDQRRGRHSRRGRKSEARRRSGRAGDCSAPLNNQRSTFN